MAEDTNYDNVVLLLPMRGANGSTVFTDYSNTPKTVTPNGDAQVSTAQSQHYGSSGLFDGTGDYLSIPSSTAFNLPGDFTIEAWVRFSSVTGGNIKGIFCRWNDSGGSVDGYIFGFNASTNKLIFDFRDNGGSTYISSVQRAWSPSTGVWYHVAVSRSSSTFYLAIDGDVTSYSEAAVINTPSTQLEIGRVNLGTDAFFSGHINDLRVTPGVARYTTNFTAPEKLTGKLSGTVKDSGANPVARTIRAYVRSAGEPKIETTSSGVDGTFDLGIFPMTQHKVVALDEDGGSLNALVYDRVIPA